MRKRIGYDLKNEIPLYFFLILQNSDYFITFNCYIYIIITILLSCKQFIVLYLRYVIVTGVLNYVVITRDMFKSGRYVRSHKE